MTPGPVTPVPWSRTLSGLGRVLLKKPIAGRAKAFRQLVPRLAWHRTERSTFRLQPLHGISVGLPLNFWIHSAAHRIAGQRLPKLARQNLSWRLIVYLGRGLVLE